MPRDHGLPLYQIECWMYTANIDYTPLLSHLGAKDLLEDCSCSDDDH